MPRSKYESHRYLPKSSILTFEEIERTTRALMELGVGKVRLTGGEPLLRRDLPRLVERLDALGVELALTTNGTQLPAQARALRRAGLDRITLSLDTLDDAAFQRLADAPGYGVADVLLGLRAAEDAGFGPVKINCVVRRELSHLQVEPLIEHFRGSGHIVRFIEFMDVGKSNDWNASDVVGGPEILDRIARRYPLEALEPVGKAEVARRYRLVDGSLEFGLITSISGPFCGDCDRLRLSADGQLFTCLFATQGHDIKELLRADATDSRLGERLRTVWSERQDQYSALRSMQAPSPSVPVRRLPLAPRVEMSFIGG